MPRFVILEHDHPHLHWDLMLESGAVLRTWRLTEPPQVDRAVDGLRVFDHRLMYLDYEGPVSGDRGRVVRWDGGTFDWQVQEEGRVTVRVFGERLRGVLRLDQVESDTWRGVFLSDEGPS
jgi:DNA polymerase ligase (LigD)-like protein